MTITQPTFKYFLLGLGLLLGSLSFAQILNKNPLSIEYVSTSKPVLQIGDNIEFEITVDMAEKHHAYSTQFKIINPNGEWLKVSKPRVKNEVVFDDPVSKKQKKGLGEGEGLLSFVAEATEAAPKGKQLLKFELEYQACTAKYCLLPIRLPFELSLNVGEETSATVDSSSGGTLKALESSSGIQALLSQNLGLTFLLVFLAGILTSFTPCIFPMIPITLAVLGARDDKRSKTAGFVLSLSYVVGIAATYSILGLIAASTGALFGGFLGHPAVAVGLGIGFVVLALGMYGLFEIRLPSSLANRLSLHKTQGGPVGAFLAGTVAGLLASPCVGPVLVGLLAFVAQTGDQVYGFALMFTFAFGMGQIFLLLGTFSQLLSKLPRSGPWMDGVKFVMGTAMVALALFYVQPVISDDVFNGLLGLVLILIASFFGAFAGASTPISQLKKGFLLASFFIGVLFSAKAIFPGLFESSSPVAGVSSSGNEVQWVTFSFEELEKARAGNKGIVIDFYADWCLACKEMEVDTFPKKQVLDLKDKFVWLKFDATNTSPDFDKLRKEHGILGLPWLLIYEPSGTKRDDLTLTGYEGPEKFAERLKKAL